MQISKLEKVDLKEVWKHEALDFTNWLASASLCYNTAGLTKVVYKFISKIIPMLFISLMISCAAHTNLAPVGKGEFVVTLSLGGPFITVAETKIPTPYLSIGTNYGLTENINVDGNLHITSLFYQLAGFDFGATWFPILNDGLIPTWGIQPRFLILESFKEDVEDRFRMYPFISSSAAWKIGSGLIYTGFDFVVPLTEPDYDEKAEKIIFSPFTGYRWEFSKSWQLLTEFKWHGANVRSNQLAVEYITIGGYGAVSLLLSLEKRF